MTRPTADEAAAVSAATGEILQHLEDAATYFRSVGMHGRQAQIEAAIDRLIVLDAVPAEPDVYIRVGDDLMIEEVCSLKGGDIPPGEHRYYASPQPAYCCCKCGMPDRTTRRHKPVGEDGIAGAQAADVIPVAAIMGDDDGAIIIEETAEVARLRAEYADDGLQWNRNNDDQADGA